MALTKVQILRCAIAIGMEPSRAKLAALEAVVAKDKRVKMVNKTIRLMFREGAEDIVLDTDQTSLQWRILKYLKKKKWISKPKADLKRAWGSAKKANAREGRKAFLGGYGKEKALKRTRAIFTQPEQWLCYQVAINGKVTSPFQVCDFLALTEKALRTGKGKALIEFLAGLHENRKCAGNHEKLNSNTLIMSLMWVFPSVPFWLLPSRIIAEFIRVLMREERPASSESISSAITEAGLIRVPKTVLMKFFSSSADGEGKALLAEISKQSKFDVSECFKGRRRRSKRSQ